jgi:hypothetical protein
MVELSVEVLGIILLAAVTGYSLWKNQVEPRREKDSSLIFNTNPVKVLYEGSPYNVSTGRILNKYEAMILIDDGKRRKNLRVTRDDIDLDDKFEVLLAGDRPPFFVMSAQRDKYMNDAITDLQQVMDALRNTKDDAGELKYTDAQLPAAAFYVLLSRVVKYREELAESEKKFHDTDRRYNLIKGLYDEHLGVKRAREDEYRKDIVETAKAGAKTQAGYQKH